MFGRMLMRLMRHYPVPAAGRQGASLGDAMAPRSHLAWALHPIYTDR
jgi:hypothetical protein